MNKNLDKVFLNQIRLEVMAILLTVDNCNFSFLKEKTNASQGNLSIQLKKLKGAGYIKIEKTFQNNYPKTKCRITSRGKKSFQTFFNGIQSYKNLDLVLIICFFGSYTFTNNRYIEHFFLSVFSFDMQENFSIIFNGVCFFDSLLKIIL